jgi:hypothetical protein
MNETKRRAVQQQADWAAQLFDDHARGKVCVFLFGRRIYFVPARHLAKALRMHDRMPGSRIIPLQDNPAARTQFIAAAITPRPQPRKAR